ncbi:MAG TPA: S24/S26 family peptidase [Candidatus Aminicenantes bacterium]|nr:S24/S26 family peptidase [Candidatus Aminicenantes bacterium]
MARTPRPRADQGGGLPLAAGPLAGLMGAVLEKGRPFRFEARGESMFPAIRDGDVLTVAPFAGRGPRPGDIVAFVHPETGGLRVHRVVEAAAGRFVLKGDNALGADPAVGPDAVLGLVVGIERGGRPRRPGPAVLAAAAARLSRTSWYTRLARRLRRALRRPARGGGA